MRSRLGRLLQVSDKARFYHCPQCPDIFINVNYTTTHAETAERLGYIRLDLEDVYGAIALFIPVTARALSGFA